MPARSHLPERNITSVVICHYTIIGNSIQSFHQLPVLRQKKRINVLRMRSLEPGCLLKTFLEAFPHALEGEKKTRLRIRHKSGFP